MRPQRSLRRRISRGRRVLHRVKPSRSVKKKSPTSVWRRSMCSTRKTRRRAAAYRSPGAVAAAAEVAEAAEAAGLAEAVVDAAAAEVAVCRGVLAASARPDRFPVTLTGTDHFGRARQSRPGQSMCSSWQCRSHARLGRLAHEGRAGIQPYREMPARELDEGIPVVGEYALHRRTKVARVLTS